MEMDSRRFVSHSSEISAPAASDNPFPPFVSSAVEGEDDPVAAVRRLRLALVERDRKIQGLSAALSASRDTIHSLRMENVSTSMIMAMSPPPQPSPPLANDNTNNKYSVLYEAVETYDGSNNNHHGRSSSSALRYTAPTRGSTGGTSMRSGGDVSGMNGYSSTAPPPHPISTLHYDNNDLPSPQSEAVETKRCHNDDDAEVRKGDSTLLERKAGLHINQERPVSEGGDERSGQKRRKETEGSSPSPLREDFWVPDSTGNANPLREEKEQEQDGHGQRHAQEECEREEEEEVCGGGGERRELERSERDEGEQWFALQKEISALKTKNADLLEWINTGVIVMRAHEHVLSLLFDESEAYGVLMWEEMRERREFTAKRTSSVDEELGETTTFGRSQREKEKEKEREQTRGGKEVKLVRRHYNAGDDEVNDVFRPSSVSTYLSHNTDENTYYGANTNVANTNDTAVRKRLVSPANPYSNPYSSSTIPYSTHSDSLSLLLEGEQGEERIEGKNTIGTEGKNMPAPEEGGDEMGIIKVSVGTRGEDKVDDKIDEGVRCFVPEQHGLDAVAAPLSSPSALLVSHLDESQRQVGLLTDALRMVLFSTSSTVAAGVVQGEGEERRETQYRLSQRITSSSSSSSSSEKELPICPPIPRRFGFEEQSKKRADDNNKGEAEEQTEEVEVQSFADLVALRRGVGGAVGDALFNSSIPPYTYKNSTSSTTGSSGADNSRVDGTVKEEVFTKDGHDDGGILTATTVEKLTVDGRVQHAAKASSSMASPTRARGNVGAPTEASSRTQEEEQQKRKDSYYDEGGRGDEKGVNSGSLKLWKEKERRRDGNYRNDEAYNAVVATKAFPVAETVTKAPHEEKEREKENFLSAPKTPLLPPEERRSRMMEAAALRALALRKKRNGDHIDADTVYHVNGSRSGSVSATERNGIRQQKVSSTTRRYATPPISQVIGSNTTIMRVNTITHHTTKSTHENNNNGTPPPFVRRSSVGDVVNTRSVSATKSNRATAAARRGGNEGGDRGRGRGEDGEGAGRLFITRATADRPPMRLPSPTPPKSSFSTIHYRIGLNDVRDPSLYHHYTHTNATHHHTGSKVAPSAKHADDDDSGGPANPNDFKCHTNTSVMTNNTSAPSLFFASTAHNVPPTPAPAVARLNSSPTRHFVMGPSNHSLSLLTAEADIQAQAQYVNSLRQYPIHKHAAVRDTNETTRHASVGESGEESSYPYSLRIAATSVQKKNHVHANDVHYSGSSRYCDPTNKYDDDDRHVAPDNIMHSYHYADTATRWEEGSICEEEYSDVAEKREEERDRRNAALLLLSGGAPSRLCSRPERLVRAQDSSNALVSEKRRLYRDVTEGLGLDLF